jgi:hypothetical protein
MVGFLLLLREFLFDGSIVLFDCWMVIITIPSFYFRRWTDEMSSEWNPFGENTFPTRIVSRWEILGWLTYSCLLEGSKSIVPISVSISIFATEPADEISVIKMEPE